MTQEEVDALGAATFTIGVQMQAGLSVNNPGAGHGGRSSTNEGAFATIDSNGNITNTVTGQNIGNSSVSAPPANDPSTASNPGLDGPW